MSVLPTTTEARPRGPDPAITTRCHDELAAAVLSEMKWENIERLG